MRKLFAPAVSQKEALTLYGRKHFLAKIHDYMTDRQMPENVALLGVKGAGKSSVIRKAFGREENRRYYDEADIVVTFVSIPETTDSMKGFYSYLNTSVLEALDAVEEYDAGRYHALMEQIAQKKNQILARCVEVDDATMESVLNKTIGLIRDAGIKLLIVFDDFERFADSSRLKKAQYRYMRELANSGKISLFIATGQDLTKVSEEMKGSGFENIFTYEELRGIRLSDIEDWISDVMDGTDVEIDDEVTDWIGEISGGIPEIAAEAAELSCRLLAKGQNFDGNDWCKKLYPAVSPLMKTWWNYTDEAEHRIFADLIAGTSADSVNRDCLVKKGYLDETYSRRKRPGSRGMQKICGRCSGRSCGRQTGRWRKRSSGWTAAFQISPTGCPRFFASCRQRRISTPGKTANWIRTDTGRRLQPISRIN